MVTAIKRSFSTDRFFVYTNTLIWYRLHLIDRKKGGIQQVRATLKRILIVASGISFVFVMFCFVRALVILQSEITSINIPVVKKDYSPLHSLTSGWMFRDENGNAYPIEIPCEVPANPGEVVTITRDLDGFDSDDEILQFDNVRQSLRVRTGPHVLYEVNLSKLNTQLMFTDYHFLEIPKHGGTITFEFTASNDTVILPEIYCGALYSARYEIIKNDIGTVIILGILILILIGIVVSALFDLIRNRKDERWIPLGLFLFFAFLWGSTDSYLPVLTRMPQELIGLISYFSLMALPLPMAAFIWISCGKRGKSLLMVMILGLINLSAQAVLSLAGMARLDKTFFSAHVLAIITIIAAFINLIPARKKADIRQEINYIMAGSAFLSISAILSILMYWYKGVTYYRNTLLIGVILFLISLSVAIVIHQIEKRRVEELKISEMKISERLSYYDQLTGMPNRRAYEKKLEEVERECIGKEDAVLIMMDVNGLKITNDTFGHSAGDDLIIAASQVVREVYENEDNSCFRIGGDEFVVIMRNVHGSVQHLDNQLDEAIKVKNIASRWKLSIARGACHLLTSAGTYMSITDWKQEADIRMFRNKTIMTGGKNRDRAKDFSDIIDCIVSTVEAKDQYTASHSDRVRHLSWMIGEKLGLSNMTLTNLEMAAHLHDIGKIGVPDNVLLKPGRLTSEEFTLMKRHSAIGAYIIGKASGMKEISEIILHHHERYDGGGYPDGLKGEEIPLESRIIAIADSIDAMTSKRVYRDSMTLDQCKEEIMINMGKMYDPAIAQIVLENWDKVEEIVLLHPKRLIAE